MGRTARNGFTLVELLVVIGIIAVLLGILLPSLNKARQTAQQAACMSNMHQLGLGFIMYCDANKGLIPAKGPDGSDSVYPNGNLFGVPTGTDPSQAGNGVRGVDDPSLWFNAVASSMGKKSYYQLLLDDQSGTAPAPTSGKSSAFVCPSATGAGTIPGAVPPDVLSADGQYFLLYGTDSLTPHQLTPITSPGGGPFFKFNMSYASNASLTNTFANTQSFNTVKLAHLRPASSVVVIAEKLVNPSEFTDAGVQRYVAAFSAGGGGGYWKSLIDARGFISNVGQPKANWKRFAARHNGGGNILFADGHVGYLKWADAQFPLSQLPFVRKSGTTGSDFNQPSRIIWSIAGPVQ